MHYQNVQKSIWEITKNVQKSIWNKHAAGGRVTMEMASEIISSIH